MKNIRESLLRTAGELQKRANDLLGDGLSFFKTSLGNIELFSSKEAAVSEASVERDETHYFLVPDRRRESGYSLYSVRVLPDGVGPQNDLPKAKVFQLPSAGIEDYLCELLEGQLKNKTIVEKPAESPTADTLQRVADEIDEQCERVSGGLVVVGGLVALANPLLGVGIMTGSFLPGLGSKISTQGLKQASNWLQSRADSVVETEAGKAASKEVRKLKKLQPEVRINPVLALLEKTISSDVGEFDPALESIGLLNTVEEVQSAKLGSKAVKTVYTGENSLPQKFQDWLLAFC